MTTKKEQSRNPFVPEGPRARARAARRPIPGRPDWLMWSQMHHAELPALVSLSLDVDPALGAPGNEWPRSLAAEYRRRLEVATNRADGLEYVAHGAYTLESFAVLARRLKWVLPEPFKPLAADVAPQSRWPWGDHHTDLLGKLADAGRQFWSTYDPKQPTTAPKNSDVIDYLEKRDVSQAVAKAMATILRPPTLPMGRRPQGRGKDRG